MGRSGSGSVGVVGQLPLDAGLVVEVLLGGHVLVAELGEAALELAVVHGSSERVTFNKSSSSSARAGFSSGPTILRPSA